MAKASPVCGKGHDKVPGKKCRVCYASYKKEWLKRPENAERYAEKSREHGAKYAASHKEERKVYMDSWHQKNRELENTKALLRYYKSRADGTYDKDKANERTRKWRATHKRTDYKKYYAANRQECQARNAAWQARNPERYAQIQYHANSRRKARLRATHADIGSHSKSEWRVILEKQRGRCAECGVKSKLEKDHIMPLSRGGSNMAMNLQGLCRSCNARKSASIPVGSQPTIFDRIPA